MAVVMDDSHEVRSDERSVAVTRLSGADGRGQVHMRSRDGGK